jgi:hypothetical protein
MKNFVTNQKGFITVFASILIVLVTGGSIYIGSAVIDSVNKKGCGDALESWQKGDLYGRLGDANDIVALEKSIDCQKAVYDSVEVAKPVATLVSAAGNIGVDKSNVATLVVDRTMDLTDNLSNPSHKNPVRDALLPSSIVNTFFESEPEIEAKDIEAEDIDAPTSPSGAHTASFSDSSTQTESANGVSVTVESSMDGSISIEFHEDGTATCVLNADMNSTSFFSGQATPIINASADSNDCSGSIDEVGEFVLIGTLNEQGNSGSQGFSDTDGFSVVGYIEDGKINGSIEIDEGEGYEVDFAE